MSLSLSHWYPGSGVVLDCMISDLCTLTYFHEDYFMRTIIFHIQSESADNSNEILIPQHPIMTTLQPPGQFFMGAKLFIGTP